MADDPSRRVVPRDAPSGGGGSASSPSRNETPMGRPVAYATILGVILAHVIGWIPIIGALATGLAVGLVARTPIRGLYASFVPAVFCMAWYWLVTYLPELPFVWADALTGVLAPMDVLMQGASAVLFSLVLMGQFVLCILGAWIGGMVQERRHSGSAARATRGA